MNNIGDARKWVEGQARMCGKYPNPSGTPTEFWGAIIDKNEWELFIRQDDRECPIACLFEGATLMFGQQCKLSVWIDNFEPIEFEGVFEPQVVLKDRKGAPSFRPLTGLYNPDYFYAELWIGGQHVDEVLASNMAGASSTPAHFVLAFN